MKHETDLIPGLISTTDASKCGIPRQSLAAMCSAGRLERVARGLYAPCGYYSENLEMEVLSKRGNDFVIALESALRFHGIATSQANELTVAMKRGARKPAVEFPLHVVRLAQSSLMSGVEEHDVNGCKIKVFSIAKTIADLFMFRNKLGIDIAKEALRDGFSKRLFTIDELFQYAAINRVIKVAAPYIEALFL